MKLLSHKIFAVLMVVVVLFSTMSFTINMHYCCDDLVALAFYKKAEKCNENTHISHCEMEIPEAASCEMHGEKKKSCEMEKDCCTDKEIKIDSRKDLKNNVLEVFQFNQTLFLVSFIYTDRVLFTNVETQTNDFLVDHPPPLIKCLYKLDEVYLI